MRIFEVNPGDDLGKSILSSLHTRITKLIPTEFSRIFEVNPGDDLGKSILELVPAGLKYKSLCVEITREIITVIENHFEIFGNEQQNVLRLYKNMMLVENRVMHVMALNSLVKLCSFEEFRDPLKNFFHEQEITENVDSDITSILLELMGRKNLRLEMMSLMKAMRTLEPGEEVINEMRVELYKTIFSGNKKLAVETVTLISVYGDDVWLQIINLLNYYVTDIIDFPKLFENLSSVEGFSCDARDLLRITIEKLNTPEVAHRALTIATQIIKHDKNQQQEILHVIDKLFIETLIDEKTFMLLVECFNVVDIETSSKFFGENPINLVQITDCLLQAFIQFNASVSMHNIVAVLKKITKIAPEYTLDEVRKVFKRLYLSLIQTDDLSADTERLNQNHYKQSITKVSVLLENRSWNLMDGPAMKIIFELCKKLFGVAGMKDENKMLPTLIRLLTNIFKHIWTRVLLKRPIPFNTEEILDPLEEFYKSFESFMNNENMNIEEGHLILTSFMDLSVMFQPTMKDRSSHELFCTNSFFLNKKSVNGVAALIEKLVFDETAKEKSLDDATVFQCEYILGSWIVFCKNYETLPSLTASEKIIRHYTLKQPFKTHIEILMDYLLTKKSIFEQTVAFVTFNLSNQNNIAAFRQFHHGLETFLSQKFNDIKSKLLILGTICSYVLAKLDVHTLNIRVDEEYDRLMVLDYVILFTKNMSPAMKQTLISYIPLDPETDDLSEQEKQHLIAFKAQLLQ